MGSVINMLSTLPRVTGRLRTKKKKFKNRMVEQKRMLRLRLARSCSSDKLSIFRRDLNLNVPSMSDEMNMMRKGTSVELIKSIR
jgi:hypothetical protein